MARKKTAKFIISEPLYKADSNRPILLRIELCAEYTKVDFGYQTSSYYKKGGWVRLDKNTFIRVKATGEKLTLVRAENIPIAPAHHYFNTRKDWLYFSLWFPPIPLEDGKIDLIEAEPGTPNDFNYKDIRIETKKFIELL